MQSQHSKTIHMSALIFFIGAPILYIIGLTSLFPFNDSVYSIAVSTELILFAIGIVLFGIDHYNNSHSIIKAILTTGLWTALILVITFITFLIIGFSAI